MTNQKETKKADKAKKPENIATSIEAPDDEKNGFRDAGLPEPTRYNDWEVKGRCSDF